MKLFSKSDIDEFNGPSTELLIDSLALPSSASESNL